MQLLQDKEKELNRRPSPPSSKQSERLSSQIVVFESFSFSFLRDCPASDDSQDVSIVVALLWLSSLGGVPDIGYLIII